MTEPRFIPEECAAGPCAEPVEVRCEACGQGLCEDHYQTDPVSGAYFCGLRDDWAEIARRGAYHATTWCENDPAYENFGLEGK